MECAQLVASQYPSRPEINDGDTFNSVEHIVAVFKEHPASVNDDNMLGKAGKLEADDVEHVES